MHLYPLRLHGSWALFQYPIRYLTVRYRKASKPRDLYLELSDPSEIWQAPRHHCYWCACQISKRCDDFSYGSRTLSYDKASYQILKHGPGVNSPRIHRPQHYNGYDTINFGVLWLYPSRYKLRTHTDCVIRLQAIHWFPSAVFKELNLVGSWTLCQDLSKQTKTDINSKW